MKAHQFRQDSVGEKSLSSYAWCLLPAVLIVMMGLLVAATSANAQQIEALPPAGISAYLQYQHSDIDSVNLDTGNVTLHIPVVSFPQVGSKLKLNFVINYNEPQWSYNPGPPVFLPPDPMPHYDAGSWNLANHYVQWARYVGAYVTRDQAITITQSSGEHDCFFQGVPNDCRTANDGGPTQPGDLSYGWTTWSLRDRTGAEHPIAFYMQNSIFSTGLNVPPITADGSGWQPSLYTGTGGGTGFFNAIDHEGVQYNFTP